MTSKTRKHNNYSDFLPRILDEKNDQIQVIKQQRLKPTALKEETENTRHYEKDTFVREQNLKKIF